MCSRHQAEAFHPEECINYGGYYGMRGQYLGGVSDTQGHHVLAGVFDQQVILIKQLHFPHAQLPQLVKELKEAAFCGGTAVALGSSPQENQQPVLQRADALLLIEAREPGGALRLRLRVHGRQCQQVILVTEPADRTHIQKRPLRRYLGAHTRAHTHTVNVY